MSLMDTSTADEIAEEMMKDCTNLFELSQPAEPLRPTEPNNLVAGNSDEITRYVAYDKVGSPFLLLEGVMKEHAFTKGKLWAVTSHVINDNRLEVCDKEFIAEVYYKWDACSHWNFFGEDYDPEEADYDSCHSYYHLCGHYWQTRMQIAISFVRCVMRKYMKGYDSNEPYEGKIYEAVDNLLLQDYTITVE